MKENSVEIKDRERIRCVARLMLAQLELAITGKSDDPTIEKSIVGYEKLFGAKSSYVGILSELTELLMRLEKNDSGSPSHAVAVLPDMAAQDMVLIEDFIRHEKQRTPKERRAGK